MERFIHYCRDCCIPATSASAGVTGLPAFEAVDNIIATPAGDLVICEDGPGDNFVRIVTPDGVIFPIIRNAHAGKSEFCGACFSPDGRTMFVNVQSPGLTFAVTGDWAAVRRAAIRAA